MLNDGPGDRRRTPRMTTSQTWSLVSKVLISVDGIVHAVAHRQAPLFQNGRMVAVGADQIRLVRHDHHRAVPALIEQFHIALDGEAVVAHRHGLVDQETVEFDGHGNGEGQARAHARGIALHRLPQVGAQLGKALHQLQGLVIVHPVHPRDQARVVLAGEAALEGIPKGQRPGHGHVLPHHPAVRPVRAAHDANHRGLARAVAAHDAPFLTRANGEVHMVQHLAHAAAVVDGVAFADVDELQHG